MELLNPPLSVDHPAPEVVAPIDEVSALVPAVSTGSPSSTTVDQDAPSPSNSQTTPDTQPPVIPNDVKEDNHDIEVAHMGNDPYFGIPILEVPSDQSSSSDYIHTNVPPDNQILEHNNKWAKDHPLENIIDKVVVITLKVDITSETRQTGRYTKEQSCIVDSWLPSQEEGSILKSICYGCKNRGLLRIFSRFVCCLHEHVDTPIVEKSKLDKDKEGKAVDPSHYHGTVNRGLWYPKDSSIALTAFADADHAGCQDTRRSISGSMQFLGDRLISWSSKRQKEELAISRTYYSSGARLVSKLSLFYNAFMIYADVPEYTCKISGSLFSLRITPHFRSSGDGKSHTVNVDNFRDMLKICPKLLGTAIAKNLKENGQNEQSRTQGER
ncbi:hypothetical protein Tco_1404281 [Tanacetum coccineum]